MYKDDSIEKMKKSGLLKPENQCYIYIITTLAFFSSFLQYTLRNDFFKIVTLLTLVYRLDAMNVCMYVLVGVYMSIVVG